MHSVRLILLLAAVHRRGLNLIPGFIFLFLLFFEPALRLCADKKRARPLFVFLPLFSGTASLSSTPPATVGK